MSTAVSYGKIEGGSAEKDKNHTRENRVHWMLRSEPTRTRLLISTSTMLQTLGLCQQGTGNGSNGAFRSLDLTNRCDTKVSVSHYCQKNASVL